MIRYLLANKKVGALVLVFIAGIVFLVARSLYAGALVHIETEAGAEIFIASEQGGELRSVGKSSASFRVKEVPSTLYVQVKSGERISLSGVHLEDTATQKLSVPLTSIQTSTKLFEGSVRDPNILGKKVQGIEPTSNTITNFSTDAIAVPRAAFIGIPYLKKIAWYGPNDFVYSAFRGGVGLFKDGKNLGSKPIARSIIKKDGSQSSITAAGQLIEAVKGGEDKLFVLASGGLYASTDFGTTLSEIATFEQGDNNGVGRHSITATESSVFRFIGELPATNAAETENAKLETDGHIHTGKIIEYDYSGREVRDFEVASTSLIGAATLGGRTSILTDTSLIATSEGGQVQQLPLYTAVNAGVSVFDNKLYVLAGSGLWQLSGDGKSLMLVVRFDDGNVGLAGSMLVDTARLVYGIAPAAGRQNESSTHFITVGQ